MSYHIRSIHPEILCLGRIVGKVAELILIFPLGFAFLAGGSYQRFIAFDQFPATHSYREYTICRIGDHALAYLRFRHPNVPTLKKQLISIILFETDLNIF